MLCERCHKHEAETRLGINGRYIHICGHCEAQLADRSHWHTP